MFNTTGCNTIINTPFLQEDNVGLTTTIIPNKEFYYQPTITLRNFPVGWINNTPYYNREEFEKAYRNLYPILLDGKIVEIDGKKYELKGVK